MSAKLETATVQTFIGPTIVRGWRVTEHFLIHRAVGELEHGVTVSHLRTGYAAGKPFGYTRVQAAALARALEASGVDWDFDEPSAFTEADRSAASRILLDLERQFAIAEAR